MRGPQAPSTAPNNARPLSSPSAIPARAPAATAAATPMPQLFCRGQRGAPRGGTAPGGTRQAFSTTMMRVLPSQGVPMAQCMTEPAHRVTRRRPPGGPSRTRASPFRTARAARPPTPRPAEGAAWGPAEGAGVTQEPPPQGQSRLMIRPRTTKRHATPWPPEERAARPPASPWQSARCASWRTCGQSDGARARAAWRAGCACTRRCALPTERGTHCCTQSESMSRCASTSMSVP